jgi:hypothetical protein
MHELVTRIKAPELCYVFAKNAQRKGHPELALQALRHAVVLRADQHEPQSEIELAALRAIYAYEEALSHIKGKRTRATGTWQLVNRHGVLAAVGKRLAARSAPEVDAALEELELSEYGFEAIRRAYPEAFDQAA